MGMEGVGGVGLGFGKMDRKIFLEAIWNIGL